MKFLLCKTITAKKSQKTFSLKIFTNFRCKISSSLEKYYLAHVFPFLGIDIGLFAIKKNPISFFGNSYGIPILDKILFLYLKNRFDMVLWDLNLLIDRKWKTQFFIFGIPFVIKDIKFFIGYFHKYQCLVIEWMNTQGIWMNEYPVWYLRHVPIQIGFLYYFLYVHFSIKAISPRPKRIFKRGFQVFNIHRDLCSTWIFLSLSILAELFFNLFVRENSTENQFE